MRRKVRSGGWVWAVAILGMAMVSALLAGRLVARETKPNSPWEAAIAAFEAEDRVSPPPSGPVLFVGSSTIRMWNLAEWFPDWVVLNRGFGGSTFADLDHYFERVVLPYKPRLMVVYSGDNDIALGRSPEDVAGDYGRFHKKFRNAFSDTPVVFIAIKPSLARWNLYDKTREANGLVARAHAEDGNFRFVDLGPAMLGSDGKPDPELFVKDGLHLSRKGYELWSRELRKLVMSAEWIPPSAKR